MTTGQLGKGAKKLASDKQAESSGDVVFKRRRTGRVSIALVGQFLAGRACQVEAPRELVSFREEVILSVESLAGGPSGINKGSGRNPGKPQAGSSPLCRWFMPALFH